MKSKSTSNLVENQITASTFSQSFNTDHIESFSVHFVATGSTPAAKSFETSDVNTTDDEITETAHGYETGLKGQFTTPGTLPAGLSLATDYFLIKVDADTYQVATSLANAEAGTQIDITDTGSGTHTFTPTTGASNTLKLQNSNDNSTWEDVSGASLAIEATSASALYSVDTASARYYRALYTPSSGQTTINIYMHSLQVGK